MDESQGRLQVGENERFAVDWIEKFRLGAVA